MNSNVTDQTAETIRAIATAEPAMLVVDKTVRDEIYEAGRQAGVTQAFQRVEAILLGLRDEEMASRVMATLRTEDLS